MPEVTKSDVEAYCLGLITDSNERKRIEEARETDPNVARWFALFGDDEGGGEPTFEIPPAFQDAAEELAERFLAAEMRYFLVFALRAEGNCVVGFYEALSEEHVAEALGLKKTTAVASRSQAIYLCEGDPDAHPYFIEPVIRLHSGDDLARSKLILGPLT